MSKKPVPKQQLAKGRSTRRYKAWRNRSQIKLMNMVTSMLRLKKKPNFLKLQEEKANRKSTKITTVKA